MKQEGFGACVRAPDGSVYGYDEEAKCATHTVTTRIPLHEVPEVQLVTLVEIIKEKAIEKATQQNTVPFTKSN